MCRYVRGNECEKGAAEEGEVSRAKSGALAPREVNETK